MGLVKVYGCYHSSSSQDDDHTNNDENKEEDGMTQHSKSSSSSFLSFNERGEGEYRTSVKTEKSEKHYQIRTLFSHDEMYEETKRSARLCCYGWKFAIFSYGRTGSGKSYTMKGNHQRSGLIYRLTEDIFNEIIHSNNVKNIYASMVEFYANQLTDLFATYLPRTESDSIRISNHNQKTKLIYKSIQSADQLMSLYEEAEQKLFSEHPMRKTLNSLILKLVIDAIDPFTNEPVTGELAFIILPGFERRSKLNGELVKSLSSLSHSLCSLGDVISRVNRQANFIPYRNSTLTYFLKDFFQEGQAVLFCHISSNDDQRLDTMFSLNFGNSIRYRPTDQDREASRLNSDV